MVHITTSTELLDQLSNPYFDQILTYSFGADLYAMACHKYALENKMSIPGDLKIVAYDGTNATRFLSPSLTTVCQPIHKLAEESVKKIVEQIAGEKHNGENLTLPVWLRKGESTAG